MLPRIRIFCGSMFIQLLLLVSCIHRGRDSNARYPKLTYSPPQTTVDSKLTNRKQENGHPYLPPFSQLSPQVRCKEDYRIYKVYHPIPPPGPWEESTPPPARGWTNPAPTGQLSSTLHQTFFPKHPNVEFSAYFGRHFFRPGASRWSNIGHWIVPLLEGGGCSP